MSVVWSATARDAAQRVMLRAIYSGLDETDAILAILTPHVEAMLSQARIEGRREASLSPEHEED